jgi:PAS domain S-box-containing protein
MWIDRHLPALRERPLYGFGLALLLTVGAIALRLFLPDLPPFLTLYPAVLLSAFVGGRWPGMLAMVIGAVAAAYLFLGPAHGFALSSWDITALIGFVLVSSLIIFVVDLLDQAVWRLHRERKVLAEEQVALRRERQRIGLAVQSARLGLWELAPPDRMIWYPSYYALLGLDPETDVPSLTRFYAMVHPDDLAKVKAAYDGARSGKHVGEYEYRLIRPDGTVIWIAEHTAFYDMGATLHGVSQDVTGRKQAEERIRTLLREIAHRVKNQYTVILGMARETGKQITDAEEFQRTFAARLMSMSRSHDLLLEAGFAGATVRDLVDAQLTQFGVGERCTLKGPDLLLTPLATQYLGIALHELATNAVKHGAFRTSEGEVSVEWSLSRQDSAAVFTFKWSERGVSVATPPTGKGFGRTVLERIAPTALQGTASWTFGPEGLNWVLTAPDAVVARTVPPEEEAIGNRQ